MGPIGCHETRYLTTNTRSVTSQKNEDLIYAVAEARRHPQLHQCKPVAVGAEHGTGLLAHDSSCRAVSVGPRVLASVR